MSVDGGPGLSVDGDPGLRVDAGRPSGPLGRYHGR